MSQLETVKVKRDGPKGYRLINKSDFNPKAHDLFDAPAEKSDEGKKGKKSDKADA